LHLDPHCTSELIEIEIKAGDSRIFDPNWHLLRSPCLSKYKPVDILAFQRTSSMTFQDIYAADWIFGLPFPIFSLDA